jgi:hypothetical protein
LKAILDTSDEEVASIGSCTDENSTAFCSPVSERFKVKELHQLCEFLNSPEFQGPLTKYNCGEPKLSLQVTLYRTSRAHAGARRVECRFTPEIGVSERERCLYAGLSYLADKAFAKIDPDPAGCGLPDGTIREPHCDCEKRDTKEEWVTYPGPDEKLW